MCVQIELHENACGSEHLPFRNNEILGFPF